MGKGGEFKTDNHHTRINEDSTERVKRRAMGHSGGRMRKGTVLSVRTPAPPLSIRAVSAIFLPGTQKGINNCLLENKWLWTEAHLRSFLGTGGYVEQRRGRDPFHETQTQWAEFVHVDASRGFGFACFDPWLQMAYWLFCCCLSWNQQANKKRQRHHPYGISARGTGCHWASRALWKACVNHSQFRQLKWLSPFGLG